MGNPHGAGTKTPPMRKPQGTGTKTPPPVQPQATITLTIRDDMKFIPLNTLMQNTRPDQKFGNILRKGSETYLRNTSGLTFSYRCTDMGGKERTGELLHNDKILLTDGLTLSPLTKNANSLQLKLT